MSPPQRPILICLLLAALTIGAHAGVRRHEFINLDDDVYVACNPEVLAGLNVRGLRWAWSTQHGGFWQPLTWMSLQLDAQLYGSWAGGFHLTNLGLHALNVVLLFVLFHRMTGAVWRSALVAALFGLHPLHVESVAWVTERKDVLSTFFLILTLGAYLVYVRRPSLPRYLLVTAGFTLGLMAKPMLVTLPAALLLLDYWPLHRLRIAPAPESEPAERSVSLPTLGIGRALLEKLPWFVLAAAFVAVTLLGKSRIGAMVSLEFFPWQVRVGNALVAYVRYLGLTVWPRHLAILYPHPEADLAAWQVVGAALLLALVTGLVLRQARRRPYLPVGWFWFLGTLVPVSGILQAGPQALADRFVYIPNLGLYLIGAWGLHDLLAGRRHAALVGGLVGITVVGLCMALTVRQVRYWHNSETLWRHTLRVTTNNAVAHHNLGTHVAERAFERQAAGQTEEAIPQLEEAAHHFALAAAVTRWPTIRARSHASLAQVCVRLQRPAEAIDHYRQVLRIDPELTTAPFVRLHLARLLREQHRFEEAREQFALALANDPGLVEAHASLGELALEQGRPEEAARHFTDLLRLEPFNAEAFGLLGMARVRQARWDEAGDCLREAIRLNGGVAGFHFNLAYTLYQSGELEAAREAYRQGERLNPHWLAEANLTAWILATAPDLPRRNPADALQLALQVCQATDYQRSEFLDTLAAAYAESRRFPEAIATAKQALAVAAAQGQTDRVAAIRGRLARYEEGQPHREARP